MARTNDINALASTLARELLQQPEASRQQLINELKPHKTLYALVKDRLKRLQFKGTAMTAEALPNEAGLPMFLQFKVGTKKYTLDLYGVEYKQHLANGVLFIAKAMGEYSAINKLIDTFSGKLVGRPDLVLITDKAFKILIQTPLLKAVKNSYVDASRPGKMVVEDLQFRFTKELVTTSSVAVGESTDV